MNLDIMLEFAKSVGVVRGTLVSIIILSIGLVIYNILYINQSLHITSSHMGIKEPRNLRHFIKLGIFTSTVSAGFSILLLILSFD